MEREEIEKELRKKEKCIICGKKTNKGLVIVGQEKNVFICKECWKGIGNE